MARPLALALLLLLTAAAFLPGAAACTSTRGPYQSVRFVATEDGATIVDLPTSIRVGPNGLCGYDGLPALHFDGRYAAWSSFHGLHVVDVDTGAERDYLRGVLTERHLALLPEDGLRPNVTLVDLDGARSWPVPAPADQSFVANFRGAVVARDVATMAGQELPQPAISVLDPVTATWILDRHVVVGGGAHVAAGSRDWIVFGDATEATVLAVATGAVTTVQTGGQPVAVLDDRLYLQQTSWTSTGSAASTRSWSVALPAGDDPRDGAVAEQHAVDDREVAFVVQSSSGTDTTTSSGSTQTGTDGAYVTVEPTTGSRTGTTTAVAGEDGDGGGGVLDIPPMGAWAAIAAVAAVAYGIRRRL